MNDQFDEIFQRAIDLKNDGHLSAAYEIALQLVDTNPENIPVLFFLATIAYEKKMLSQAAQYFKRVTLLSPKAETASLGLFHSLFALGNTDGAFDEMKRFMAIRDSDEYEVLLKDITEALKENE
jgi:tetratricopeptide (TPR) repeat protein